MTLGSIQECTVIITHTLETDEYSEEEAAAAADDLLLLLLLLQSCNCD